MADLNEHINRGVAFYKKREYDRAIADFTQAIALNPSDHHGYLYRGDSHAKKGDFGSAKDDYREACRLSPQSDDIWEKYGNAAHEEKRDAKREGQWQRSRSALLAFAASGLLLGPLYFIAYPFAAIWVADRFSAVENGTTPLSNLLSLFDELPLSVIFTLSVTPLGIYLYSISTFKRQLQQHDLGGAGGDDPKRADASEVPELLKQESRDRATEIARDEI